MQEHAVSIAIVPFRNLTPDQDEDYFIRGFLEDLITELSRFPSLEVISAESSFAVTPRDAADPAAGRLRARYLLQGSFRRGERVLRINAQLVEADAGRNLWAQRFDAALDDLTEIQDEIVASVANALP